MPDDLRQFRQLRQLRNGNFRQMPYMQGKVVAVVAVAAARFLQQRWDAKFAFHKL
jgi:hypothetical protein